MIVTPLLYLVIIAAQMMYARLTIPVDHD